MYLIHRCAIEASSISRFEQFCTDAVPFIAIVSTSMALIRSAGFEDGHMGAKKVKDTRRRMSGQYDNLIKSINRKRNAAEDIGLEKTKDESDPATITHDGDRL